MTRPLGEPSVPLGQARQGYDIRQLQRRPARSGLSELGAATQEIYLSAFANPTNCDVSAGVGWVWDFTTWSGGYVTRSTLASDGDYFSFMALLSPQGSIWQLSIHWWVGPDFGKMDFSLASLGYELSSRELGCPGGKIQDFDATYGDALNYLSPAGSTQDFYAAAQAQETVGGQGIFQIIPGGDVGAPLTDLTDVGNPCTDNTGVDPLTLVNVMDGGPGWYRFKFQINGKNASSTGFKFRITRAALVRLDDELAN